MTPLAFSLRASKNMFGFGSEERALALARASRILVLRSGQLLNDITRGHSNWTEQFLADALRQPELDVAAM
jgi:hypothetical protein